MGSAQPDQSIVEVHFDADAMALIAHAARRQHRSPEAIIHSIVIRHIRRDGRPGLPDATEWARQAEQVR